MSVAAPVNVTVSGGAPVANFVPLKVSERLAPWAPLPGIAAERRGLVTVKVWGGLTWPLTATVTGPSVAFAGTVTVSCVDVAPVSTVAGTRVPLNPAKVTEFAISVVLKPVPTRMTLLPSKPAVGVRLVRVGAAGGVLEVLEGDRKSTRLNSSH